MSFAKELEILINKHSLENDSNTPDFLLAEYLCSCLDAFNLATKKRMMETLAQATGDRYVPVSERK